MGETRYLFGLFGLVKKRLSESYFELTSKEHTWMKKILTIFKRNNMIIIERQFRLVHVKV